MITSILLCRHVAQVHASPLAEAPDYADVKQACNLQQVCLMRQHSLELLQGACIHLCYVPAHAGQEGVSF